MTEESFTQDGVGEPDDLERLWTPHRMAYIKGENKPTDPSSGECPFCRIPDRADDEGRYEGSAQHDCERVAVGVRGCAHRSGLPVSSGLRCLANGWSAPTLGCL